jgi:hypothetical protein
MSITIDNKKYYTTILCNDKFFIKKIYEMKIYDLFVLNQDIEMEDYLRSSKHLISAQNT